MLRSRQLMFQQQHLLALELEGCNLAMVAPEVGRDASSLSSAARRITERAGGDQGLQDRINRLREVFAGLQA